MTMDTDQYSQPPTAENHALGPRRCSLLVECTEDEQTFTARQPHNKLRVWKGRDFWHQDISVQVRLEPDGGIYISTQEGHVSTLRAATITIEQLHALIRGITANDEMRDAMGGKDHE